ncbi:MAG: hypothetical protein J3R72DRAFT_418351 [Linnemannia gamsii]|nr:MAG: hypothetical protein J3R72DRAFT_418351 [Linnemannia gamsii]
MRKNRAFTSEHNLPFIIFPPPAVPNYFPTLTVRLMGSHPPPLSKTEQHNNPHPHSTSGRTPSRLLQIPELLCPIFSYIDRYTITNTVVLVCRQWFLLNQDRLFREVTWDANWKPCRPGQALKRLPGADRLVIRYSHIKHIPLRPNIHTALQDVQDPPERWGVLPIAKSPQKQQQQQQQLLLRQDIISNIMTGFDHPLSEFVLITADKVWDRWKDELTLPSTLTSITMHNFQTQFIDVGRVLAICPVLKTLHLSATVMIQLSGPWTDRGLDAFPNRPLPLRSLVLSSFKVRRSWIEALLSITPDLEELQLIDAADIPYVRVVDRWIWAYFYKYLQSPPLRLLLSSLKRFHYSHLGSRRRLTDEEVDDRVFSICPSATEQTFYHHELTPRIAKGLMDAPYALTTLELLLPQARFCKPEGWRWKAQDKSTSYTTRPLHQLLCESPRLRHLKSLKMSYMTDFMDVHRRIEMFHTPPSSSPSPPDAWDWGWGGEEQNDSSEEEEEEGGQDTLSLNRPGIWGCRDLETLHLEMHYHGEKGSNLGLLQDVVDMVEEMDTDEFVCLPALRRLACGHHLEQRPEKELGSFMRNERLYFSCFCVSPCIVYSVPDVPAPDVPSLDVRFWKCVW